MNKKMRITVISLLSVVFAVSVGFLVKDYCDSYTLDWNAKTISITAYPETKAESRLINGFIADSSTKFKRVIQPA